MLTNDSRITRVEKTLRWLEEDLPLLNVRVKDLSKERQESAKRFAAAVIKETRTELQRLLEERPTEAPHPDELPCEPAD